MRLGNAISFVIPGQPEGLDPQSRHGHDIGVLWIPGSPAEPVIGPAFGRTRWPAPRNDEVGGSEWSGR